MDDTRGGVGARMGAHQGDGGAGVGDGRAASVGGRCRDRAVAGVSGRVGEHRRHPVHGGDATGGGEGLAVGR